MPGQEAFRPENKKNKNQKAGDEVVGGNHFNKLYDENEDRAGQRIDEATGEAINNTPVVDGADEVEDSSNVVELKLPALPDDPKKLEKWIKEEEARLRKKKAA